MKLFQNFGIRDLVIRGELRKRECTRYISRGKALLSAYNKKMRKKCTEDHHGKTKENWDKKILD